MTGPRIDYERYSRQIKLLGEEGQRKLRETTVLLIGVGGLGSYIAYELVALGIGKLILVDPQTVELSNLNRQILYATSDVGKPKVEVAKKKLSDLNPDVVIEAVRKEITPENIRELVAEADIVVDGLDNWATRLIVNDECVRQGKIFVHGGVREFYGQILTVIPGKGPCLRCIIPQPPREERLQVISGVVGLVASMEVVEVIKVATGKGRPAYDRIVVYDGLEQTLSHIKIARRPDCPACSRYYESQAS